MSKRDRSGFIVDSDSSDSSDHNPRQMKYHNYEAEMEEEEESLTLDENDLLPFFAAMNLVRASGICNMYEVNCVIYQGVIPVLGLWDKLELVRQLVKLLQQEPTRKNPSIPYGKAEFFKIYDFWRENISNPDYKDVWENNGAVRPYGRDYVIAHENWPYTKNKKRFDEFKTFLRKSHPEWNWQRLIVEFAKKLALETGVKARDDYKIDSLRNVFDEDNLRTFAAQLGYSTKSGYQSGFGKKKSLNTHKKKSPIFIRPISFCNCN